MYKILANLPFKTNHVHYLPSCHSTNEVAQNMVQSVAEEGTVIITDDQFAGKGQSGNQWVADPGLNLTLSLILKPVFLRPNQQFLITAAVSLGIKDALEEILPGEVKVKWPNDIYYRDRKIAGLLIENILRGNQYDYCIIGLGLNVNQKLFRDGLRATSVKKATGKLFDLNSIFNKVLTGISIFYFELKEYGGLNLIEKFHEAMLGIGDERRFKSEGKTFIGKIEGVDDFGRLIIKKGEKLMVFQHKEVEMLF